MGYNTDDSWGSDWNSAVDSGYDGGWSDDDWSWEADDSWNDDDWGWDSGSWLDDGDWSDNDYTWESDAEWDSGTWTPDEPVWDWVAPVQDRWNTPEGYLNITESGDIGESSISWLPDNYNIGVASGFEYLLDPASVEKLLAEGNGEEEDDESMWEKAKEILSPDKIWGAIKSVGSFFKDNPELLKILAAGTAAGLGRPVSTGTSSRRTYSSGGSSSYGSSGPEEGDLDGLKGDPSGAGKVGMLRRTS